MGFILSVFDFNAVRLRSGWAEAKGSG